MMLSFWFTLVITILCLVCLECMPMMYKIGRTTLIRRVSLVCVIVSLLDIAIGITLLLSGKLH